MSTVIETVDVDVPVDDSIPRSGLPESPMRGRSTPE